MRMQETYSMVEELSAKDELRSEILLTKMMVCISQRCPKEDLQILLEKFKVFDSSSFEIIQSDIDAKKYLMKTLQKWRTRHIDKNGREAQEKLVHLVDVANLTQIEKRLKAMQIFSRRIKL